jgi:hypothetical protein
MSLEFEWDSSKARQNERKHGIAFLEASTAFADPHSITIPDSDHSVFEHRLLLLGLSESGKLLVVSHTERSDRIRIISVRYASKRERKTFEQIPS